MATVEQEVPPLVAGERLSRAEFIRRWELHPEIKRAELIGGVVFMPSPLRVEHGFADRAISTWLGTYQIHTPGTRGENNATNYLLEDAPQADNNLRLLPECGGASWIEGGYVHGPAELVAETCFTSAAYDLHEKKDLYEAAGVKEYLAVLIQEQEIRWHWLVEGRYELMPTDADGIWRSRVFPGLWLDGEAFLAEDLIRVLAVLDDGIKSPGHREFVAELARRRSV